VGLGGLIFFCCTSFGVYTLIGRGWSSNSLYSIFGTIRGVAQTISYEVRIALLFIGLIFIIMSYNLMEFIESQDIIKIFFNIFTYLFMLVVEKPSRDKSDSF